MARYLYSAMGTKSQIASLRLFVLKFKITLITEREGCIIPNKLYYQELRLNGSSEEIDNCLKALEQRNDTVGASHN